MISAMSTKINHLVWRAYLVDINFHAIPILRDSLDDWSIVFFLIVNRLCVPKSVLSRENSTDHKEKYRTDDITCTDDNPWNVVTESAQWLLPTFLKVSSKITYRGLYCAFHMKGPAALPMQ